MFKYANIHNLDLKQIAQVQNMYIRCTKMRTNSQNGKLI